MMFGRAVNNYGGFRGFMGLGAGIFMFVCMAVLITAAVLLIIRHLRHNRHQTASNNVSPLEVLKMRYASGEITDDEFKIKKEELLK